MSAPQYWFDFLVQWDTGGLGEVEELSVLAEDEATALDKLEGMGVIAYERAPEGSYT